MQPSGTAAQTEDYRQRYEELTGRSLLLCPQCRQGQMKVVETFPRPLCRAPCPIDSS
jgi:hypothetical protein